MLPGRRRAQLDGFAGQRLTLAGEQQPRRAVDVVAAAARPTRGIARPALGEPPAPVPLSLFHLFYLVEIRHRQLLQSQSRTRSAGGNAQEGTMRIWQLRDHLSITPRARLR
jgi:hypothetical protein